jgi:hypothetical protein
MQGIVGQHSLFSPMGEELMRGEGELARPSSRPALSSRGQWDAVGVL